MTMLGKKHSAQTKNKMSLKRKKYLSNPTHRKNIGLKQIGKNNHQWRGGRKRERRGYILLYAPNHPFQTERGYKFEHRIVVEEQIGRYLTKKEVVHHIGKNDDNRPHMLIAFIHKNAHLRFHRGLRVDPHEIIFDGRKLAHC